MIVKAYEGKHPQIHLEAFLAENATIIGDVTIGESASIWYGAVLRADVGAIHIGKNTCVEDNVVLHADVFIEDCCVIGHGAIIQNTRIETGCMVGMGAVILDGCVIGKGSIIAAGSLVPPNTVIPPNSMVMGNPAVVTRPLRSDEQKKIADGVKFYIQLAQQQLTKY